nr:complex I assembly factor TIMMDC1, mitochondrial-like [Oncorhynchus nerka]
MHPPGRPWVSPAPCQQAASAPQGTLCTGPLRGLQLAMPSLGRLLPRVHAADTSWRSAHNAAIRGFVRYGWRWSWRVAAFVTLFNTVCRDKYTLSHYAGERSRALFMSASVPSHLDSLIIAMQGLAGALISTMQGLAGETVRERRERRELYELKLAEWSARLQLTDDLIGDLSSSGRIQDVDKDIQKIQELLSLPWNESVAQD